LEHLFVKTLGIEALRGGDGPLDIVEPVAGVEERLGDGAVDQPGVEVAEPVVGSQPFAERTLAGSRRSVDGDDHEYSAPSPRIIGTKLGKLVAMNEVSSTPTGLSLASPITRNAIAMRWSMWVTTSPPPGARPLPCTIRSSPSISNATPLTRSPSATAASRSA